MAFELHSSQQPVQPPDKTTEGRAVNTGMDLLVTGDRGLCLSQFLTLGEDRIYGISPLTWWGRRKLEHGV